MFRDGKEQYRESCSRGFGTQGCLESLSFSQICSRSLFFIARVYFPVKAQVQIIEICSLKLKDAKVQGDRFMSLI